MFVGNNPQAKQVLEFMQRPADKIAFGFQGTAAAVNTTMWSVCTPVLA